MKIVQNNFKKVGTFFKNLGSCFCLNKTFFISLFILIISIIIIVALNIIDWVHQEKIYSIDQINIIIGVFISISSIIFAYCLGEFFHLKWKRINIIENYINYVKIRKQEYEEIKSKLKEEFIYTYEYIKNFMEKFIKNFFNEKLDLFFMEKWKKLNFVYKNLNTIAETYKINLIIFQNSIKTLKNLKWSDCKINEIIKDLVGVKIEQKRLEQYIESIKFEEQNKKAIVDLSESLSSFSSGEFEVLKRNFDEYVCKVEEKYDFCKQKMNECNNHSHNKRNENSSSFCWISIRKLINSIYDK